MLLVYAFGMGLIQVITQGPFWIHREPSFIWDLSEALGFSDVGVDNSAFQAPHL